MTSTMKAIKIVAKGKAELQDAPIPKLRPEYVLVRTVAVALNPTDWKHITRLAGPGVTVGCDFSGIVEDVGENCKLGYKKGDRVAGFTHGSNESNPEDGAFAEYALPKEGLLMRIPDGMSFEEAATLGVGVATCGQSMYQSMKLPLPTEPAEEKFPILIYGGSSATGALAIQFAKLSGLEVITTASPHNFDYLKSLGADAVFDYNSPTCGADIRKYTNNNLYYVLDCISQGASPQICADALTSAPSGRKPFYGKILNVEFPRDDVDTGYTLGYTAVGEAFKKYGREYPPAPQDYEFSSNFMQIATKLLEERKIKPHRYEIGPGGLNGVFEGLDRLKNGKVSGVKLVYKVSET